LQLTSVRILLVDDFAPWRQVVSSILSVNSELQIVGEASDGPEAIIFLSQESSDDVVQEALSTGASGYVVKTLAGTDLLTAMESVSEQR
jgi:DNA-binding NarL/FixJ family response regulator